MKSVCVNPASDNIGEDIGHPSGRPPGSPCNQNDDVDENDYSEQSEIDYYEEHVPFNHHRYPDGQHGVMYMKLLCCLLKIVLMTGSIKRRNFLVPGVPNQIN